MFRDDLLSIQDTNDAVKDGLRTFAPKNFPHTDFFKTLTDGRK